jgi:hypothetical protein
MSPASRHDAASAALVEAYAYLRAIGRRAREEAAASERPPHPTPDDETATAATATVSGRRG